MTLAFNDLITSYYQRFTHGKCDDCSHTAMKHFSHFNKHILNPIKRTGYIGEGKHAMLTLKEEVLCYIY